MEIKMETEERINVFIDRIIASGVKIAVALAVMFISFKIINALSRKIERTAERKKVDKTITHTAVYVFKIGAKLTVAICLIGYVGIDTSAFAALITSLGVGIGLAVNGALSNLAGGVLMILTRPFRIDDYIETQGYSGTVEDIHITNTRLRTPDNKVIYIPNGPLSTGNIVNYSLKDTRRVDEVFSVSYSADFNKAKAILAELYENHPLVLKDPAPFIRVSEHAASSINITVRVWVNSADYWTVKFDMLEAVKEKFDLEGIEIPFDQMDVHIKND